MQREALPQDSTSPPSLFQMRMRTSALGDGSMTMSWSQPMPVLRSAMARAASSLIESGRARASSTTKSLPRPFILRNGRPRFWAAASVMPPYMGKGARGARGAYQEAKPSWRRMADGVTPAFLSAARLRSPADLASLRPVSSPMRRWWR